MNFLTSLFSTDLPKRLLKLTPAKKCSSEESKWQEKAVESLIKKLKSQSDALVMLEKVLEQQSAETPCVTINKTQDGRMQINQKKIYPHVAYCRLWRWPNLNNHNELKAVGEHCSKSFYYSKLNEVCINPFHYERVQSSLCAASSPQLAQNSLSNDSFASSFNGQLSMDLSINDQSLSDHSLPSGEHQIAYDFSPPSDHQLVYHSSPLNEQASNFYFQDESPVHINNAANDALSVVPYPECDYYNQNNNNCPENTGSFDSPLMDTTNSFANVPSTGHCCPYTGPTRLANWCSIVFYSYGNRLGTKTISADRQIISGLDLPDYLARHQGIEIRCKNGEVFFDCNFTVYIQSPFLNSLNRNSSKHVEKLEPTNQSITKSVKIFDEHLFRQEIDRRYSMGYDAVHELIKYSKCTLSFYGGWNQHEILQKPCWLEITLDSALTTLDHPLSQLGSSNQQATSVS